MPVKHEILEYLSSRDAVPGRELWEHLGITRQAFNVHMRELIRSGKVQKSGSTRGARYALVTRPQAAAEQQRTVSLKGLEESKVYDQLATPLSLRSQLRSNVEAIVQFAFTEILNNAIEHSQAEHSQVRLRLEPATVTFQVRDRGIGVFQSLASKLQLEDEQTALVELLKGKATTMPSSHTGEGIFFTSRAVDRFVLRSHRIRVEWDHYRDDVIVSKERFLAGTDVQCLVDRATRRKLEAVFEEFAPAEYDYRFDRTRVLVRLLQADYLSRSEAKRLLANLERFREVVLDFKDVRSIGQGFADEIFRVFAGRHPEVRIEIENANPVVAAMLRHVGA